VTGTFTATAASAASEGAVSTQLGLPFTSTRLHPGVTTSVLVLVAVG
jgi:hypothetical protein